ncbi:MAG: carboxypeptidase-like regulatory domain-containing protein [Pyrinomonadaceae bacterium]|nr:carboxypeptidase-like regulatory domain-containing protein [Pyrinomonadaceae bacterium]
MLSTDNSKFYRNYDGRFLRCFIFTLLLCLPAILTVAVPNALAQGPVNGGFEGRVTDGAGGKPIPNISVIFVNLANGYQAARKTDQNGYFRQDTLPPGVYQIKVEVAGFKPREIRQVLYATRSNETVPLPIILERESVTVIVVAPDPNASPVSTASTVNQNDEAASDISEGGSLNPRRDEAFNEFRVSTLPLGGTTLTRTFDELAFLAAGVAPPPQAIGNTVGPGVGGGVGTSGQFSVNGLRSRANNFTVDGSDNNDEDIGVRRQGFFSLVPQPIESIQEFQIITLLAPAQFGRNLGAQVNALSKSGGNRFHGTLYGFFNSDRLNARNLFDNAGGNTTSIIQGRQTFGDGSSRLIDVCLNGSGNQEIACSDASKLRRTNSAGGKDPFTLLQGGFAIGGRIVRDKMFFFVSGEKQVLNATQERHFAVPTVEQRGFFGAGAAGLQQCVGRLARLVNGQCRTTPLNGVEMATNFTPGFPTSVGGDAVFSLFPFANDPNGIFGRNTYTQALSADARGLILSGKFDYNFSMRGRAQTFTARYNFTDDRRDLTDVGGALFSSIRPLVRTNNFSSYLSGGLTDKISNEFRFSWGQTDLEFEELRDTTGFILPVSNVRDSRFLLNAQLIENFTLPIGCTPTGCFAANRSDFRTFNSSGSFGTTAADTGLGAIGQLIVSGFSPVGVDVFNFPQQRTNNTFQLADTLRWQIGKHSLAFGTDLRRAYLSSDLPRNSRPLVTFTGGVSFAPGSSGFAAPIDFAASGAATGFFQSLALSGKDARIKLSYNQLNFFAQDDWRIRQNINLSYGVRYEYNTTPKEADDKIESTFNQQFFPASGFNPFSGLKDFIDGRSKIYEGDKDNFAARFGFAVSPTSSSVIRGGFGMYYDQILGAVVSQSRNVSPTFTTANFGGGRLNDNDGGFSLFNPSNAFFAPNVGQGVVFNCFDFDLFPQSQFNCRNASNNFIRLLQPGTSNFNPALSQSQLQAALRSIFINFPFQNGNPFGATLPKRNLDTPVSYQYSIGFEQKLFQNTFLSIAYVGTNGRNLLRFTTPNLGANFIARLDRVDLNGNVPVASGTTFDPFVGSNLQRPNPNIGSISQFETTGNSLYDSLQFSLRGRFTRGFQYQASYVYGKVEDDVSDVFDLAGAFALPQDSLNLAAEFAPANFDVRHRFTYSFVYDLSGLRSQNNVVRYLLGGWQVAGTGKYNTGQPFTVNTIFDVNFDGNLTDRLDNTRFIRQTDNRRQPLVLTSTRQTDLQSMLADFGDNGTIQRNSFRAGSILELDLSFIKRFNITESQNLQFRADFFNFINRANFGIPVRFLESPGFGQAADTVTPNRRIQLALKYTF